MKNTYEMELRELKGSFKKALIFCVVINAAVIAGLLEELSGVAEYGLGMSIGEFFFGLMMFAVIFGWWFSFMGFAVVNYRHSKNPSASIKECLGVTLSGKKYGISITWKGPMNAMEVLSSIRELESMVAAETERNTAMTAFRSADF